MTDLPEHDEFVIGCLLYDPDLKDYISPGSEKRECAGCQRAIWLSPSGMKMVAEKGAKTLCVECIEKQASEAQAEGHEVIGATYEQNPLAQNAVAQGADESMVRRISEAPLGEAMNEIRERVEQAKRREAGGWTEK